MRDMNFNDIPNSTVWKRASATTFGIRRNEPGLTRLDELIDQYNRSTKTDESIVGPLLLDMFLTIEYWFKMRETLARRVDEGRLPAMRALFEIVVKKLGPFFSKLEGGSTAVKVSNGMKKYVGLGLTEGGFHTDSTMGFTNFSAEQVWSYRLWFKGGLAYQVPWWSGNPSGTPQLANSKHGYSVMFKRNPNDRSITASMQGWSPFIMTLSRFIYMAKHDFDATRLDSNYFHSSYNDGHRVAMAGTILIQNGRIVGVRTDSGHYHPGLHNLTSFLLALRMYQVNLHHVRLLDFTGAEISVNGKTANAVDFLKTGKTWEMFRAGAFAELKKNVFLRHERADRWGGTVPIEVATQVDSSPATLQNDTSETQDNSNQTTYV